MIDPAVRRPRPRSPDRSRRSCSSPPPRPMPTCSWCCACSTPTARRSCLQGAVDPAHADRTGMAARLASQARPRTIRAVASVAHPRRAPAAHPGRDRRARRGDLADLDRGARRLPGRTQRAGHRLRVRRHRRRGRAQSLQGLEDARRRHLHPRRPRPPSAPTSIGGITTVHAGPNHPSSLLLPVIPPGRVSMGPEHVRCRSVSTSNRMRIALRHPDRPA